MNEITAASTATTAADERGLSRPLAAIVPPAGAPTDLRTAVVRADTWLTYNQVAELLGCDPNTVRNHRMRGLYPNARKGPGRSDPWLIPVTDLVTAGELSPERIVEAAVYAEAHADARRTEALRADLAAARAEISGLHALVGRQDDQITFLRGLLGNAHGPVVGAVGPIDAAGPNREAVA